MVFIDALHVIRIQYLHRRCARVSVIPCSGTGPWLTLCTMYAFSGRILRKESTKRKRNKPQRPLAWFAQEQLPVGVQARSCIGAKTCVSRLHNDAEIPLLPRRPFPYLPGVRERNADREIRRDPASASVRTAWENERDPETKGCRKRRAK